MSPTADQLLTPWKPSPQRTYILENASIVDPVSGTILPNRTVTLAGGLIKSITHTTDTDTDSDSEYVSIPSPNTSSHTTTIDLTTKFLCPGLIDCHVHIAAVPGEPTLASLFNLEHNISLLRQPYVVNKILSRGFTTIRDCGGATLALKEGVAASLIPGPRMFIAGQALSQTGGHGDPRGAYNHFSPCCGDIMSLARVCDGVADCIKAAREELRLGADFIKIMAGGGVASPTDPLDGMQFSSAEIRAICEVASNAGTYVTAHAYTPRAIRHAIENGVMGIEHGNLLDESTARLMAEKGVFLTPTLVTYRELGDEKYGGFVPGESGAKNEKVLKAGLESITIAKKAGVTICFGTDLLGPMQQAQTGEFGIRKEVLSAAEVLRSATVNAAKRLRQEAFLGRVEEGYAADLLLLNVNPLEDIEVFDRPEKHLLAVFKDGRIFHSRWSDMQQDVVPEVPLIA